MIKTAALFTSLIFAILFAQNLKAQPIQKKRVIILSDIEADPDDSQSLVRLLLYSNVIDIKGLIVTTSCWHKTKVDPESIIKIIQAYGKVQPNLLRHETGFPDPDSLIMIVKQGLPKYGMLGVGDGNDSQGSDWIIKVLEDKKPLIAIGMLRGCFVFAADLLRELSRNGARRRMWATISW